MDAAPIISDRGYCSALREIEGLMDARPKSPEGDRLDLLVALVELWERKHYEPDLPN
jgi:HTH-type transcriptional regulator/antitoxin HigA